MQCKTVGLLVMVQKITTCFTFLQPEVYSQILKLLCHQNVMSLFQA
jgi:hypothetical protein